MTTKKKWSWLYRLATRVTRLQILFSGIFVGLTFLVGLWQFSWQRRQEKELEYRKVMIAEQARIYKEGCLLAGQLIAKIEDGDTSIHVIVNSFEAYYWGEMNFVTDDSVRHKANRLRAAYDDLPGNTADKALVFNLKKAANEFVAACRDSFMKLETE